VHNRCGNAWQPPLGRRTEEGWGEGEEREKGKSDEENGKNIILSRRVHACTHV